MVRLLEGQLNTGRRGLRAQPRMPHAGAGLLVGWWGVNGPMQVVMAQSGWSGDWTGHSQSADMAPKGLERPGAGYHLLACMCRACNWWCAAVHKEA